MKTPFVTTALDVWFTDEPECFARDFQINDTVYRRLDPEYYAWLRSRMALAKKAATAGQLDADAFEHLRVRFNAVRQWAVERFGEEQLRTAVRAFRAYDYAPPVAEDERSRVQAPHTRRPAYAHISPQVAAMVDAISERALSLGWSRERLYGTGNDSTFHARRGLVYLMKPGDRIGEVTAQSIEIILAAPSDVRQRFYNPDVDQPWIKKIAPDTKTR